MDAGRRPGAFSPMFTSSSPPHSPPDGTARDRSQSFDSDSSASSQVTSMSQSGKRGPTPTSNRPTVFTSPRSNASTPVLQNYSRPTIAHVVSEGPSRKNSPLNPGLDRSHKRNNSQGFFEPSLPTLTDSPTAISSMGALTPSQIAAQAAMQSQGAAAMHFRRRSQTIPSPVPGQESSSGSSAAGRTKPTPSPASHTPTQTPPPEPALLPSSRKGSTSAASALGPNNGIMGPPGAAAASAASAAYPRAAQTAAGLPTFPTPDVPAEKIPKSKAERAKQIFSKSKQIAVPTGKDIEKSQKTGGPLTAKLPSPTGSVFTARPNASSTSLADTASIASGATTMYSMANASTSTLVPSERSRIDSELAKEQAKSEKESRHRTHIFSRPKKHRDKVEDQPLTLSSAASNSMPVDPSAPRSIYNFAPSSPAPGQLGFAKSASGLDLRHPGGKKKKDEFDFAASFGPMNTTTGYFLGSGTLGGYDSGSSVLHGFGLNNMTPDDAWDLLKAKLLVIFEGEELRIPVEDLNRLVSAHIQRCVQLRSPTMIIEDLRDLLETGFSSLDMTLKRIQEERLVPQLVDMWLFVFGTLLPYIQSVFLPLDLELRGHGTMSPQDAAEFWGLPTDEFSDGSDHEVDVRRCTLLSFRDSVILPRHDLLKTVFSRLSLESINVGLDSPLPAPPFGRPGTAGSLDPTQSSFNSQGSTLISDSTRSRATSNTSAPELPTFSPTMQTLRQHHQLQSDSSHVVTETVGRMLQCMSVLVSVHSEDEAQAKMEDLTKTLKLNWLGRGRTGRNRKGLVGARVPRRATPVIG